MLNSKGFDLWADGYDQSVGVSDEDGTYPFAGYRQILNEIYNRVLSSKAKEILDIGFGTGTLAAKLYGQGCNIWGQDFSEKMIAEAKSKMPNAMLYKGDFSKGLANELKQNRYDAIIATYSLHHLADDQKIHFIKNIIPLLNEGGHIYIGDVVFETRAEMNYYKNLLRDEWDDEELYFVIDELRKSFPQIEFIKFSFCSGMLSLAR